MAEPKLVLEVLSEEECERLLTTRFIGRIAFTIDDQPEIFPVNYVAEGSTVVFRTGEATRLLESIERRVAFEIDDLDPVNGLAWSVMVRGVAQEITGGLDTYAVALRSRDVVPLAPGKRERWLAIYPTEVSGRRFHLK